MQSSTLALHYRLLPEAPVLVVFVVGPVTVFNVVVVHGPLSCVVKGCILPHVGDNLVNSFSTVIVTVLISLTSVPDSI